MVLHLFSSIKVISMDSEKFLKLLTLLVCLIKIGTVQSQDVKFSQYFTSPLTVNPALCGLYNGQYRLMGNYRNQWQEIMYPYTSATFSAESQIPVKISEDDILAVGINGLTDRSNNGGLRNSTISGTISFHKALDMEGISRIGVGLQAAYVSKVVDYSKMTFEPQFTPIGYDISLPTNELSNGFTINYLDYSAGIVYSYLSGDFNIYGGASVSHISRPNENYSGFTTKLPLRYTIHGGASVAVGQLNTIYLSLMHMRTSLSNQTTMGMVYGINFNGLEDNQSNEFLFGTWLRLNDAVVPYLGLKYGKVNAGLSYDITTSKVTIGNKGLGGIELSMQILLERDPDRSTIKKLKCKSLIY